MTGGYDKTGLSKSGQASSDKVVPKDRANKTVTIGHWWLRMAHFVDISCLLRKHSVSPIGLTLSLRREEGEKHEIMDFKPKETEAYLEVTEPPWIKKIVFH